MLKDSRLRCIPRHTSHSSAALAVLIVLLIAWPLSAQVTSTSTAFILSTPVAIGSSSLFPPITITVAAGTTLTSNIKTLTLGAPNLDFTLVQSRTTCPTLTPVSGASSSTCTVEVQFTPTAAGRRLGALVLADQSGNTYDFSLDGAGLGPMAAFNGIISTFAGTPLSSGYSGDGGSASSALLAGPNGLAFDGFGNLYIADQKENVIRKVATDGTISTFAGNGSYGYAGDGGAATSAELNGPMAVVVGGEGGVYIADTGNNVIRLVNQAGIISTYAGQYYDRTLQTNNVPPPVCSSPSSGANVLGVGDGCPFTQADLDHPTDLVFCHAGNLHIADTYHNLIRTAFRGTGTMITQVGLTTTSTGVSGGYNGDGELNTAAALSGPTGIDMDAVNNIYIADMGNNLIRKTLLTGLTPNPIYTVAGTPPVQYLGTPPATGGPSGSYSGNGGPATSARFSGPSNVRVDPAGDIFISDQYNEVIREVNAATQIITTVAGNTTVTTGTAPGGYGGDGGPATSAEMYYPADIVLDNQGKLYISDHGNSIVRVVNVSTPPTLPAFANTTVGTVSATQNITVSNMGSASLPFTQPTANFSLDQSDPSACTTSTPLAPATSCALEIEFAPTTAGLLTGSEVISAKQTIALSGTAASAIQSQTITFSAPAAQTYGTPLTLAATASSSLPVSYTVVSGSATLSGSTLKFTGVGSVTVQASQAGNAGFSAATAVSVTFQVNPEAVSYTAVVPSSSTTVSVSAGSSGSASLNLTSSNYSGTISFTTSVTSTNGTPSAVTVTASPVTLTAGSSGVSKITITTTTSAANHLPRIPGTRGGVLVFCAVLLGLPFTRKRALPVLLTAFAIALGAFLIACGGGGSTTTSTPKAARTYTVTVTPSGTANPTGDVTVTNPSPVSFTVTVQ